MARKIRSTLKQPRPVGKKARSEKQAAGKKVSAEDKGDYVVGKYRPPLHTQFRKGDGRKRPGRKPGSKNLRTIIMEAAHAPVNATVEGKTRKITRLQATAMQLSTKAATGDTKSIVELLDWVDGIEARAAAARPSEYPLSDADMEVIRAVYSRLRPWGRRGTTKWLPPHRT